MVKNNNILSFFIILALSLSCCVSVNAAIKETKKENIKNFSVSFSDNSEIFLEKTNSVIAEKQIEKTITRLLKNKENKLKEEKNTKNNTKVEQEKQKELPSKNTDLADPSKTSQKDKSKINYMIIADGGATIPEDWDNNIFLVEATNIYGGKYLLEEKTYNAFLLLRESLLEEGIDIEIDSARRTWEEQQALADRFREKYGQDYVDTYFSSTPSEHATGLAIDLCIDKDGVRIDENEDMLLETEIFSRIHNKLADYGFILSYPDGHAFTYEPWHIRYIDNKDAAKTIMESNITLREYLNQY